jgi:type I restriction-modification system DNA methylase subunit
MQTALPNASDRLSNEDKAKLWAAADKLRGHMDAAEYKHTVLGIIFLKYISDAFEERHAELAALADEGYDPDDKDEYIAEGIFWVPEDARWSLLKDNASRRSGRSSTARWSRSSARTPRSAPCCRRATPARRWTRPGSAS